MKHKHTKHKKKNQKHKNIHKKSVHKKKLKQKLNNQDKIAQLKGDYLFEVQELAPEHILHIISDSSLILEPSSSNEMNSSPTPTQEDRETIYAEILELELRAQAIRSLLKREWEDVEQVDTDCNDQIDDSLKGNQSSENFHVIKHAIVCNTDTEKNAVYLNSETFKLKRLPKGKNTFQLKSDLKTHASNWKTNERKKFGSSTKSIHLSNETRKSIKYSADCKQKSTSAKQNSMTEKKYSIDNANHTHKYDFLNYSHVKSLCEPYQKAKKYDKNYVKLQNCKKRNVEGLVDRQINKKIIDKHSNKKDMAHNEVCDQKTNQNLDKLLKIKYLKGIKPKVTSANIFEKTIIDDENTKTHETEYIQIPSQNKWSDKNLMKIITTSKMCAKLRKKMQSNKQVIKKLE